MYKNIRSILFLCAGGVLLLIPSANAQSSQCPEGYVAPALPAASFGAPYSFQKSERSALLTAISCTEQAKTVRAGDGAPTTFIYPIGYVRREGKWEQISFIPAGGRSGAWLTGNAYAVVQGSGATSIAAYICESTPRGFLCGCRDAACAGSGRWTLQTLTTQSPQASRQTSARQATTARTPSARWLMGYYPSWDKTRLEPADIDFSLMTHIAFGPVTPRADGSIVTSFDMTGNEGATLARDISRRAVRAGVTPMLFVGGGAEGRNGWVGATSPQNVDRFARALVREMDALGFSGLDIDWEPLLPEDYPALERLAKKLRELRPDMPMTLAVLHVNANQRNEHLTFFRDAHQYFDQINVMTYDMAGVWSGWDSWHHSALFGESSTRPTSIAHSMRAYADAGVPKNKLGVGAPFYGYCKEGVDGPRQSFNGRGRSGGAMSYRLIMRDYFRQEYYRYDDTAHASYLSFPRPAGEHSCTFITYMDERDARERAQWARREGYGGIIVWSLGQAHMDENSRGNRHPLLKALQEGFLR